ncbi:leukocyte elastase inhibitor A-like [Periplaneta americana]|uniref:leukocyte elastase inhibitor A-like n=1 Tax=Periplaneta americana TaxID=6978 RepID=UPI0037E9AB79
MCKVKLLILLVPALCSSYFERAEAHSKRLTSEATSKFTIELLKVLVKEQPGNCIISPLSIYTTLAMLQQGARSNSRAELNRVLHADYSQTKRQYRDIISSIKNMQDGKLEFANKMHIKSDVSVYPDYQRTLTDYFHSDIESIDFSKAAEVTEKINSWVAEKTHDRIKDIISEEHIRSDAHMLLINAMYFKSPWAEEFPLNSTSDEVFSPSPGVEVKVPTMSHSRKLLAGRSRKLGLKWVMLPFQGNRFSMVLMLPTERHALTSVMKKIPSKVFKYIFKHTRTMDVDLRLPKFKLNSGLHVIRFLQKLGVRDIFKKDVANLKGICPSPLHVSDIIHKSEIEIDEKGTTASAATIGIGTFSSLPEEYKTLEFHANHPFAAFVCDRDMPLFSGAVFNPSTA